MKRLLLLTLLLTIACHRGESAQPAKVATQPAKVAGDPERGRQLAAQYGCTVCHVIPGVEGQGVLGPSLQGLASRPTISFGAAANTPENLIRFIGNPASVNPQSSMPPMALPPSDAQDITAYLVTLR